MAAVTIEQAVRSMLTAGSTLSNSPVPVPDARVTHGYRLQETILPAVTYSVDSKDDATLSGDIKQSQITVTGIAVTSKDALTLSEKIGNALLSGTYDTVEIHAIIVTNQSLQQETIGISDEQEPAQAVTTATIYWSN